METSVPPPPSTHTHTLLGQSPLAHKWATPPAESWAQTPKLLTPPCPGPQSYSLSKKGRSFKRQLKMQSWPTAKMTPALIRKWWEGHGNDSEEWQNFPMTPTLYSLCTCLLLLKRTFPPAFSAFTSPQRASGCVLCLGQRWWPGGCWPWNPALGTEEENKYKW